MTTTEEAAERNARRYREYAYWYHVGRQDQAKEDGRPGPQSGDHDFATYAADRAREYHGGRRTSLDSLPELYRQCELVAEHCADGPGKYQGNAFRAAASYVHALTMDGCDEECGTIDYGPGWHGLVRFDWRDAEDLILLGWERGADDPPESRPVAAIVREDDRGFVDVAFYDSEDAALADWAEVQGECDAAEDDDA